MVAFLVMIAPAPISGSQNTTIRIKWKTAGDYPEEIQWKLYARSSNVAFLIDPDESAALLSGTGGEEEKTISVQNGNYTIFGKDAFGDGWNNAVLTVTTLDEKSTLLDWNGPLAHEQFTDYIGVGFVVGENQTYTTINKTVRCQKGYGKSFAKAGVLTPGL